MTEETERTSPRADADRGSKSGYRTAAVSSTGPRTTGGAGVQRSHLRDRKSWLKSRTRAGRTWAQRKATSTSYCPAKGRGKETAF